MILFSRSLFSAVALTIVSTFLSSDICSGARIANNPPRDAQNLIPKYPYDENTTRYCAWWLDNNGSWTCSEVEEIYGVPMADFGKWNPSITIPCSDLPFNQSFCIAAYEIPTSPRITRGPLPSATVTIPITVPVTVSQTVPVTVSHTLPVTSVVTSISVSVQVTTLTAVRTTSIYPTPSAGGNGITTLLPYQPGMADNCKSFYYVRPGDTCDIIAAKYHISTAQLLSWNPNSRSGCTRLLANTYCCVGVL